MYNKSISTLCVILLMIGIVRSSRRPPIPAELPEVIQHFENINDNFEENPSEIDSNLLDDNESSSSQQIHQPNPSKDYPDDNDDQIEDEEFNHIEDFPGLSYVNSIEKMAEIGINVSNVNVEILVDAFLTAPELIEKYGYKIETHNLMTDDGYILELHRMPPRRWRLGSKKKHPVFLQHGILDSSSSWVLMGPGKGLAYLLSDMGYDVWMGNARGNRYSRKHISLNPDGRRTERRRFWQFSWHEIGMIDVPNMIDYVLNKTNAKQLHYIGHSQGTTAFWVMTSSRPEYNDKILSMQAMAPVAFLKHNKSPFVRASTLFLNTIDAAAGVMGLYEFMPTSDFLALGGQMACREEAFTQVLCTNVLFLLVGYNSNQLNETMLPVILGHLPAGASTNQLIHYGQLYKSGHFRQYDWGMMSNILTYGSLRPTKYDLSNVRAPVALHYSTNDWMAQPKDVESLHQQLPNVIGKFLVPDPKFNHLDFMYAIDVKNLLYNRIFNIMRLVEQGDLPL